MVIFLGWGIPWISGILGDGDEEEVNIYRNKILIIIPQIQKSQQIETEMYPSTIEEFSPLWAPSKKKIREHFLYECFDVRMYNWDK